jgi:hypothetical protein
MAPGRVLFVGGIPADAPAAEAAGQLRALCPAATHVDIRDPHRGWALVAFRGADAAGAAAAALQAATTAGGGGGAAAGQNHLLGWRLEIEPALRVPAKWPAEWTMSHEELAAAAKQQEVRDLAWCRNGQQRRYCSGKS